MAIVRTDDGVALSYESRGDGPRTLLFMHGWAGSGAYFDPLLEHLDLTGLRALTFDLRGHGESDKPETGFDHDRFAKDAFAVADDTDADEVVVVGFSMSARFAQYLSIVEPARVAGQILIAGCPAAEIPLPPEMLADWYSREGDAHRMAELVTSFTSQPVDQAVLREFGETAAKVPRVALEQTMTMCMETSFADKLADVRTPSLVIGGVHDQMFTADLLREAVVAPLAGSRLVLVDAGHEIPIERPRETATLIEAFVAGLGTGAAAR